jgi:hypothetical protein
VTLPPGDVAAPLYEAIGPDAFTEVAHWLQDIAADHGLELDDGKVISPSVAWLAEAVTFYTPEDYP